jgi:hypothetical protein
VSGLPGPQGVSPPPVVREWGHVQGFTVGLSLPSTENSPEERLLGDPKTAKAILKSLAETTMACPQASGSILHTEVTPSTLHYTPTVQMTVSLGSREPRPNRWMRLAKEGSTQLYIRTISETPIPMPKASVARTEDTTMLGQDNSTNASELGIPSASIKSLDEADQEMPYSSIVYSGDIRDTHSHTQGLSSRNSRLL